MKNNLARNKKSYSLLSMTYSRTLSILMSTNLPAKLWPKSLNIKKFKYINKWSEKARDHLKAALSGTDSTNFLIAAQQNMSFLGNHPMLHYRRLSCLNHRWSTKSKGRLSQIQNYNTISSPIVAAKLYKSIVVLLNK